MSDTVKRLIVFEGNEGTGKSTHIKLLSQYLSERNIKHYITREPGGSEYGEVIREMVLDKDSNLDALSDALLLYSSRFYNFNNVLIKKILSGEFVITDRFHYSTLVYSLRKKVRPGLDQGKEVTHPGRWPRQLSSRDPGNFLETVASKGEEEGVTTTAEPVLGGLEDSATFKVLVLCFHAEVHHGIDHVLKLVGTSHLTRLVNLTDDDSIAVMLLAVVSNHCQAATILSSSTTTIGVLPIIQRLEAVHDEEEGLVLVTALVTQSVAVLQESRDRSLLASMETVLEVKTLSNELHLVEAFLSSVEHHQGTVPGEAISHLQHHGSLTTTRSTSKESHSGRSKSTTTQSRVDVINATLDLVSKLLRNLNIKNVRPELDVIRLDVELHGVGGR